MEPLLFVSVVVLAVVHGIFIGRLYTGFALPSLKEDFSWLPSRQIDQVKRYIDNEERAGRTRWYHGIARRTLAIQAGLVVLLVATAVLSAK
jgi:hypothetical protein